MYYTALLHVFGGTELSFPIPKNNSSMSRYLCKCIFETESVMKKDTSQKLELPSLSDDTITHTCIVNWTIRSAITIHYDYASIYPVFVFVWLWSKFFVSFFVCQH